MHIVYATLTKLGGTGGDVIHISELTEELVRCGVRVTLVGSGKPQENLEGVEVIDAGRIISRGIFTRLFTFFHLVLRVFYQVLRLRRGADVLYTRDALLGCWFTTLRGLFRLPVVFEVNGLRAEESRMIFAAGLCDWEMGGENDGTEGGRGNLRYGGDTRYFAGRIRCAGGANDRSAERRELKPFHS